jgi:hypothetical protein
MSIEGKYLNTENIFRKVFDHTTDSLKVNTSSVPTSVIIDSLDDSIAIGDAITGDKLVIRPDGTFVVGLDATSLAALENIQVTIENVDLDIRNLAFATDKVDVSGSTVALDSTTLAALENTSVEVTSSALPLGAATSSLQTSGNSSLTSIDSKLSSTLSVLSVNELVPVAFDQVTISSKNGNGDPLVILYKLATVTVATLTCTYDIDGDLSDVVRT